MLPPLPAQRISVIAERVRRLLGASRGGRAMTATLSNVAAQLASSVAQLMTVPLVLNRLGSDAWGAWAAALSLVGFASLFDLGLGNSLVTLVATAEGTGDRSKLRGVTSAALLAVSIAGFTIATTGLLAWHLVPRLPAQLARLGLLEVHRGPALLAILITVIALPATMSNRIRMGLQRGHRAAFWQTVSSILAPFVLWGLLELHLGFWSLPIALVGTSAMVSLIGTAVLFTGEVPALALPLPRPEWSELRETLRSGFGYWGLQVATVISFQLDALVLSSQLGLKQAAVYSATGKLFWLVSTVLSLGLGPLWPAYTEAIASGNAEWVRRTFRRSLLGSIALALIGVAVLAPMANPLLGLWTRGALQAPTPLVAAFGAWTLLTAISGPVSIVLNATRAFRFTLIAALISTPVNFALSVALTARFGLIGPVLGSVTAQLTCVLLPLYFLRRRTLAVVFPEGT